MVEAKIDSRIFERRRERAPYSRLEEGSLTIPRRAARRSWSRCRDHRYRRWTGRPLRSAFLQSLRNARPRQVWIAQSDQSRSSAVDWRCRDCFAIENREWLRQSRESDRTHRGTTDNAANNRKLTCMHSFLNEGGFKRDVQFLGH